eukprot:TRINITY_DN46883_c0_g1_i1.p1 TRINITY_DN46883_c0_g1~~TRINITY_DN46883_c0_g1_i1.p1  ORF type:complete len:793 (+),score=233.76 TRINITY_DN46883_c0_g1_i1:81-2381(+)
MNEGGDARGAGSPRSRASAVALRSDTAASSISDCGSPRTRGAAVLPAGTNSSTSTASPRRSDSPTSPARPAAAESPRGRAADTVLPPSAGSSPASAALSVEDPGSPRTRSAAVRPPATESPPSAPGSSPSSDGTPAAVRCCLAVAPAGAQLAGLELLRLSTSRRQAAAERLRRSALGLASRRRLWAARRLRACLRLQRAQRCCAARRGKAERAAAQLRRRAAAESSAAQQEALAAAAVLQHHGRGCSSRRGFAVWRRVHLAALCVQAAGRGALARRGALRACAARSIQKVYRGWRGRLAAAAARDWHSLRVWKAQMLWEKTAAAIATVAAEEKRRWGERRQAWRLRLIALLDAEQLKARRATLREMEIPARRLVGRWATAAEPPWRRSQVDTEAAAWAELMAEERRLRAWALCDARASALYRAAAVDLCALEARERSELLGEHVMAVRYSGIVGALLAAEGGVRAALAHAAAARRAVLIDAAESLLLRADIARSEHREWGGLLRGHEAVVLMLRFADSRKDGLAAARGRAVGAESAARTWLERGEREGRRALADGRAAALQLESQRLLRFDDGQRPRGPPRRGGSPKDVVFVAFTQDPLLQGGAEVEPAATQGKGRTCALHLSSLAAHTAATAAALLAQGLHLGAARVLLVRGWGRLPLHETLADSGVRHGAVLFGAVAPLPRLRHPRQQQQPAGAARAAVKRLRPASADVYVSVHEHQAYRELSGGERQALLMSAATQSFLRQMRDEKAGQFAAPRTHGAHTRLV